MAASDETHVKKWDVPTELKTLLKEYPALRVDEKKGKVCCCLTGHEMPLRVDVVQSFVEGKKFLKAQGQREYDFDQFRPHLVPNTKKRFQHTLFCTLTLRTVTKRPADVERHVNGKRYQRALKRWQRCQETGEKFKPRAGRKRCDNSMRREDESASDQGSTKNLWHPDSGDEDDADEDELNDLYPSDDSASTSEEEEEKGENAEKDVGNSEEESDDSDPDTADAVVQKVVKGSSSHTAVKRKKPQKPGGKKKRS